MNRSKTDDKAQPDRDAAAETVAQELARLRADLAALAGTLQDYGAESAEALRKRAQGLGDEGMAEALRAVKDLRQQIDKLQSRLEGDVRASPLAWLAGALGLGLLIGLLFSHRD